MEEAGAQDEVLASRTTRAAALYDSPLARKMRLLAAQVEAEEAEEAGEAGEAEEMMDAAAGCHPRDGSDETRGQEHAEEGPDGNETQAAALAAKQGEMRAPPPAATPLPAAAAAPAATPLPAAAAAAAAAAGGHADVAPRLHTGCAEPTAVSALADGLPLPRAGEPASDWYYIDRSGMEQGPHPLAHMRYWVETAAIPASTLVRPCTTGAFLPAASFEPIVCGLATDVALGHGPADEALDRTSSVTKGRAKRARRPPSKRRAVAPSRLIREDMASPASTAVDPPCLQPRVEADTVEVSDCADVVAPEADVLEMTDDIAAVDFRTSQGKRALCACCAGRPDNERRRA